MRYREGDWRRYSDRELIYFTNFIRSPLIQKRLILMAELRHPAKVAIKTGCSRPTSTNSINQGIREALWRIQLINDKYGTVLARQSETMSKLRIIKVYPTAG